MVTFEPNVETAHCLSAHSCESPQLQSCSGPWMDHDGPDVWNQLRITVKNNTIQLTSVSVHAYVLPEFLQSSATERFAPLEHHTGGSV